MQISDVEEGKEVRSDSCLNWTPLHRNRGLSVLWEEHKYSSVKHQEGGGGSTTGWQDPFTGQAGVKEEWSPSQRGRHAQVFVQLL